jgi:predicted RNase H-like HicB family nuclease
MHDAIDAHLEVMREHDEPIPEPRTHVAYHPTAA